MIAAVGAAVGSSEGLVRDFAIILAVAGGALLLFRQFKLPAVLGYLVAGAIIGPYTLPYPLVENVGTIGLLADLGLVLLLFGIGLEMGWQRIRGIGPTVVFIALLEFVIMLALGFQVARWLGWGSLEGVFLGVSISISSSAILMKMLRDTGNLQETRGRLIVGILVVEDFIAVVMLTVLAGVASSGAASPSEVGLLVGKLAIFGLSALGFGALFAPRLVNFISRFKSDETLLITGLALCFVLALAGQQLGLSAAAGAFFIGAVLGDSPQSEEMGRVMSPVRDMFAAIFFVSIGMLLDVSQFQEYWVPALVVSGVFIVGKVLADTAGTLLAGYRGRTALKVGLGMPQTGEFSLAIAKVGTDFGVVGGGMYPVMAAATVITALVYPPLFHSADALADFLDRRSPAVLKRYGEGLFLMLAALSRALTFNSPRARRVQRLAKLIVLNLAIILVLIGVGTGVSRSVEGVAQLIGVKEGLVGLLIGSSVLALCVPSAVAIWRYLRRLSEEITRFVFPHATTINRGAGGDRGAGRNNAALILTDSILVLLLAVPTIFSIPLISKLLSLGGVSAPVPILILAALLVVVAWAAFQIQGHLEGAFGQAILGSEGLRRIRPTRIERRRSRPSKDDQTVEATGRPPTNEPDDASVAYDAYESYDY